jgi:hypothetical protein
MSTSTLANCCSICYTHSLSLAADGAILALGTVFSHNMVRNIGAFFPVGNTQLVTKKNLLTIARIVSVPMTVISALIASFYPTTGYLLTVAFDVVLASVVVPLLGAYYTKTPRPLAALCAMITGIVTRVIMEFAIPKDGFLIMPFPGTEFLNYGSAASTAFPTFFDKASGEVWDPSVEQCEQERYNDWTGIDSLVAPVAAFIVFATVQFLERNGPIFNFSPDGVMGELNAIVFGCGLQHPPTHNILSRIYSCNHFSWVFEGHPGNGIERTRG